MQDWLFVYPLGGCEILFVAIVCIYWFVLVFSFLFIYVFLFHVSVSYGRHFERKQ